MESNKATDVLEAERLVKVDEAARFLCLSPTKVYEFVASGRLRAVRMDRNVRVAVNDLCAFKEAHTSGGIAPAALLEVEQEGR